MSRPWNPQLRRRALLKSGARCLALLLAAMCAAPWPAIAAQGDAAPRPGEDFYRYANSDWLRETTLPADGKSIDTTAALRQLSAQRVQALVQAAASGTLQDHRPGERVLARMVGDFYNAEADAAAIEQAGLGGIAKELAAIAAIHDGHSLAAILGHGVRLDDGSNTRTESLLGIWVHQGFHDPHHYAVHLLQGGLGLASREDYLDAAPAKAQLRDRYRRHVATLLALAHFANPEQRAAHVLELETAIARTQASRADTDDVFKTDNAWGLDDFAARAPGLDWPAFFAAAHIDRGAALVVWQPSAVIGVGALATGEPLDAWKDYLALHLIEHYAPVLPRALAVEHLALLSGFPDSVPTLDREQQAIAATNAALDQAVGRLFVARYFPPEAKAAANAMVETIRGAFRERIRAIAWLSPATRARALAKLDAMQVGMGYPDRWIDVPAGVVRRGEALANRRRLEQFSYGQSLARLAGPVDPAAWSLAPQSVGALINLSPNALQFSAGLLQPPFFDPQGDPAANYGSAGAGLSHEIWHSFDELGHVYDEWGRLGDWWTESDLASYRAFVQPLATQYASYCPQPGLCVHGEQVLVESVADLVGLTVAHDAYLSSLKGAPDVLRDGLTGEQRFFRAFAQRWRRLQADDALRRVIATDTHPPGEYRAATVRNLDAWYGAFGVSSGDRLYLAPEQRVRLP